MKEPSKTLAFELLRPVPQVSHSVSFSDENDLNYVIKELSVCLIPDWGQATVYYVIVPQPLEIRHIYWTRN